MIQKVKPQDITKAAHVMTRSFEHEPFTRWAFSSPSDWPERVYNFFHTELKMSRQDLNVVHYDNFKGVANFYLVDPGQPTPLWGSFKDIVFCMWCFPWRWLEIYRSFMEFVKHRPKQKHLYVETLAVDPDHQRQGVGKALLQYIFDQADREEVIVYLETCEKASVDYYQQFGFKVVDFFTYKDGFSAWCMQRD